MHAFMIIIFGVFLLSGNLNSHWLSKEDKISIADQNPDYASYLQALVQKTEVLLQKISYPENLTTKKGSNGLGLLIQFGFPLSGPKAKHFAVNIFLLRAFQINTTTPATDITAIQ